MSYFFTILFVVLFFTSSFSTNTLFAQDMHESTFPKSYDNPQKVKFYDKAGNNVRFWVGLEEITSDLYERAYISAVLETKPEFREVVSGKNYYKLLLLSYEGGNVNEALLIKWVDEALLKLKAFKAKSSPEMYHANLKNEAKLLR